MTEDSLQSSCRDIGRLTDTEDRSAGGIGGISGVTTRLGSIATLDAERLGGRLAQRVLHKHGRSDLVVRLRQPDSVGPDPESGEGSDDVYEVEYPPLGEPRSEPASAALDGTAPDALAGPGTTQTPTDGRPLSSERSGASGTGPPPDPSRPAVTERETAGSDTGRSPSTGRSVGPDQSRQLALPASEDGEEQEGGRRAHSADIVRQQFGRVTRRSGATQTVLLDQSGSAGLGDGYPTAQAEAKEQSPYDRPGGAPGGWHSSGRSGADEQHLSGAAVSGRDTSTPRTRLSVDTQPQTTNGSVGAADTTDSTVETGEPSPSRGTTTGGLSGSTRSPAASPAAGPPSARQTTGGTGHPPEHTAGPGAAATSDRSRASKHVARLATLTTTSAGNGQTRGPELRSGADRSPLSASRDRRERGRGPATDVTNAGVQPSETTPSVATTADRQVSRSVAASAEAATQRGDPVGGSTGGPSRSVRSPRTGDDGDALATGPSMFTSNRSSQPSPHSGEPVTGEMSPRSRTSDHVVGTGSLVRDEPGGASRSTLRGQTDRANPPSRSALRGQTDRGNPRSPSRTKGATGAGRPTDTGHETTASTAESSPFHSQLEATHGSALTTAAGGSTDAAGEGIPGVSPRTMTAWNRFETADSAGTTRRTGSPLSGTRAHTTGGAESAPKRPTARTDDVRSQQSPSEGSIVAGRPPHEERKTVGSVLSGPTIGRARTRRTESVRSPSSADRDGPTDAGTPARTRSPSDNGGVRGLTTPSTAADRPSGKPRSDSLSARGADSRPLSGVSGRQRRAPSEATAESGARPAAHSRPTTAVTSTARDATGTPSPTTSGRQSVPSDQVGGTGSDVPEGHPVTGTRDRSSERPQERDDDRRPRQAVETGGSTRPLRADRTDPPRTRTTTAALPEAVQRLPTATRHSVHSPTVSTESTTQSRASSTRRDLVVESPSPSASRPQQRVDDDRPPQARLGDRSPASSPTGGDSPTRRSPDRVVQSAEVHAESSDGQPQPGIESGPLAGATTPLHGGRADSGTRAGISALGRGVVERAAQVGSVLDGERSHSRGSRPLTGSGAVTPPSTVSTGRGDEPGAVGTASGTATGTDSPDSGAAASSPTATDGRRGSAAVEGAVSDQGRAGERVVRQARPSGESRTDDSVGSRVAGSVPERSGSDATGAASPVEPQANSGPSAEPHARLPAADRPAPSLQGIGGGRLGDAVVRRHRSGDAASLSGTGSRTTRTDVAGSVQSRQAGGEANGTESATVDGRDSRGDAVSGTAGERSVSPSPATELAGATDPTGGDRSNLGAEQRDTERSGSASGRLGGTDPTRAASMAVTEAAAGGVDATADRHREATAGDRRADTDDAQRVESGTSTARPEPTPTGAGESRQRASTTSGVLSDGEKPSSKKTKYNSGVAEYNVSGDRDNRSTELMSESESQSEPSFVYRQPSTQTADESDAEARTGDGAHTQFSSGGQPQTRSHTAEFPSEQSGGVSTDRPTQVSGTDIGGSPFDSGGSPDSRLGATASDRDDERAEKRRQRGQDRLDDLDVPLSDQSMQLNADVDRLVDILYRKLERKRRMERKRRGF